MKFNNFTKDENAATAIEYALIATGIAVAVVAAINILGINVLDYFQKIASAFPK